MTQDGYIVLACITDVPLKTTLCVPHLGKEALLCHTSEGIFAVDAAQKLSLGKLKGHKILCLLHGAAFDVQASMHSRGFDHAVLNQDEARVQQFHDWLAQWMGGV